MNVLALFTLLPGLVSAAISPSCRLATFLPFSDLREGPEEPHANPGQYGYGNWLDAEHLQANAINLLAAAEMARKHFNTRDTSIVPELETLKESCDTQLTDDSLYWDSGYNREKTVDQLLDWNNEEFPICAVIGPVAYEAHAGLAAITEHWHIPQVAFSTLDHKLSRDDWFPNFVRLTPTGTSFGETMPAALARDIWDRRFVANIYEEDYGEQFENPIEDAEDIDEIGYETLTESYTPGDDESLYEALNYVTDDEDGYRTVLLTMDQWSMIDDIAYVANKLKVVGEGYFWAITGDALPLAQLERLELDKGDPLDILLDGAAVFTNYDRFMYRPENDKFLEAWRKQGVADVVNVVNKQPQADSSQLGIVPSSPDAYFQQVDPVHYASFMYDAVMATGISACAAAHFSEGAEASENLHVDVLKRTTFTGASGPVKFMKNDDDKPGPDRDPAGVLYGLHNVRPVDQPNGKRKYETVLIATYETEDGEGKWTRNDQDFFFHGQTTDIPTPEISASEHNYLSFKIRSVGFTLVATSLVIGIGSGLWIFLHRHDRAIKASQPEFLVLVCFGACLVAVSLVFLSYDEEYVNDVTTLSRMCVAFPWFFVVGYEVMYCALVCKLWRLSRVLQMRRRKVALRQVLCPFAAVTFSILIVMTVWTLEDPLRWERDEVMDDPRNTYGRCVMDHNKATYLAPLGALVLMAMVATATLCWQLRDVQSDLAESRWIFFGIFGHLQVWAIGIPLLIIAEDTSRDVSYIMTAALSFILSTTLVACVIWPKIYSHVRETYFGGDSGGRKTNVNVSGKGATRVSGLNYALPSSSGGNSGSGSRTGPLPSGVSSSMSAILSGNLSGDQLQTNGSSSNMHMGLSKVTEVPEAAPETAPTDEEARVELQRELSVSSGSSGKWRKDLQETISDMGVKEQPSGGTTRGG